jgi:hypothetical protein
MNANSTEGNKPKLPPLTNPGPSTLKLPPLTNPEPSENVVNSALVHSPSKGSFVEKKTDRTPAGSPLNAVRMLKDKIAATKIQKVAIAYLANKAKEQHKDVEAPETLELPELRKRRPEKNPLEQPSQKRGSKRRGEFLLGILKELPEIKALRDHMKNPEQRSGENPPGRSSTGRRPKGSYIGL